MFVLLKFQLVSTDISSIAEIVLKIPLSYNVRGGSLIIEEEYIQTRKFSPPTGGFFLVPAEG